VSQFSLQLLSDTVLILRRPDKDMFKNLHWSSYKVPDILDTFYFNLNFLDWYSKSTRIPNFGKIRPVRAGLFHADGGTYRQTLRS